MITRSLSALFSRAKYKYKGMPIIIGCGCAVVKARFMILIRVMSGY